MKKLYKKVNYLLIVTIFIFLVNKNYGAVCTATATSNWTLASTWSCGHAPACNDQIVIPAGCTVTISSPIDLTGLLCLGSNIKISGVVYMVGNTSRLDLVSTSTITINAGGKITTDNGSNSQKIFIGSGPAEWDSNTGGLTGPWKISDGVSQSTLPVELVSFTANCVSAGTQLKWKTLSETNNDYFILEKSNDAYTWSPIAKIEGANSSNVVNEYNYIDTERYHEIIFYRISQIDFDGSEKQYPPTYIDCQNNSKEELIIFPNPASNELNIMLNANAEYPNTDFILINIFGQTVFKSTIDINKGYNSFNFPIDIQDGVYSILIPTVDVSIFTKKIIIKNL